MTRFVLNAKDMFIGQARDEDGIHVFQTDALYESQPQESNWNRIASIGRGYSYSELEVHGVVIRGSTLKELGKDLQEHDWIVNNEGLMYMRGRKKTKLGIYNKRLHDSFGWSKYGVTVPEVTTVWHKYDLYTKRSVDDAETKSLMQYKSRVEYLEEELEKVKALLKEKEKKLAEKELKDEFSYLEALKGKELEVEVLTNKLFAAKKQTEVIRSIADSLVNHLEGGE